MSWRERWPFALGHWIRRKAKRHPALPTPRYGNPDQTSATVWRDRFFDDSSSLTGQGGQTASGAGTVSGTAGPSATGQGGQSSSAAGARGPKPPSTATGLGRWPYVINAGQTWARRAIVRLSSRPWLWFGHADDARARVWRDWFDGGGSSLTGQGGQSATATGTVSGIAGPSATGQGSQSSTATGTVSGIAGPSATSQGGQSATSTGSCIHYPGTLVTGGVSTGGASTRVLRAGTGEQIWAADHGGTVYAVAIDANGNVYTGGTRIDGVTTRKYDPYGGLLWSADHGNTVRAIAVDADGYVYTSGSRYFYTTRKYQSDGTEIVADGWPADHGVDVYAMALDASGNVYTAGNQIAGSPYYTTRKYNPDGALQWSHNHGAGAVSIAVISDGARVAVGGIAYSYTLDILTASSGAEVYRYTHEGAQINGVAAGRTALGGADDTVVTASNRTASNLTVRELDYDVGGDGTTYNWSADHGTALFAVAVDGHDGSTYVGGARSSAITTRKYDDSGAEVTADAWPLDHGADVRAVAWSPFYHTPPCLAPGLPLGIGLGVPDVREVVYAPGLALAIELGVPEVSPPPAPPDLAGLAVATVYRLYVTGGPLLQLPMASLQSQRRLGQSTWITVVVPDCTAARLADLAARQAADGRLVVYAGIRRADGTEEMGEFMQAILAEIDGEQEPRAGPLRIRGRLVPTAFVATTRPLRAVTWRGKSDGKREVLCAADPLLRPNDTVTDGDDSWTAGVVDYEIRPNSAVMRVREA